MRSRPISPGICIPQETVRPQPRSIGWCAKQLPAGPIGLLLTGPHTKAHPNMEWINRIRAQLQSMPPETFASPASSWTIMSSTDRTARPTARTGPGSPDSTRPLPASGAQQTFSLIRPICKGSRWGPPSPVTAARSWSVTAPAIQVNGAGSCANALPSSPRPGSGSPSQPAPLLSPGRLLKPIGYSKGPISSGSTNAADV